MGRPRFNSHNVRPRYTGGSPAAVREELARHVARQERIAYEQALSGAWGEEERARAETLGLDGIVYELWEEGSGKKFRWLQRDLITDRLTRRLDDATLRAQGWVPFEGLPAWARTLVLPEGTPLRARDIERSRFRVGLDVERYQPELVEL